MTIRRPLSRSGKCQLIRPNAHSRRFVRVRTKPGATPSGASAREPAMVVDRSARCPGRCASRRRAWRRPSAACSRTTASAWWYDDAVMVCASTPHRPRAPRRDSDWLRAVEARGARTSPKVRGCEQVAARPAAEG